MLAIRGDRPIYLGAMVEPEILKPSASKNLLVYLIFTISGAAALTYQVIWARWLGLVFGNTTLSISIVLGSFMLGLAMGSWLAGRFLNSIENPMRFYALMELGIGAFALCFPAITRLVDYVFPLLVHSVSLTGYSLFMRAAFSIAVLIVPTTLMGTTLPLLTDFFHRSPAHTRNWRVGLLYAANTLGAALGIVATSFILIDAIGIRSTSCVAAGLNILVAIAGYWLSRSVDIAGKPAFTGYGRKLTAAGRSAVAIITASGFLALASEVLWTRTLELIVGNSTYAFASIVLLYLIGIAAGSWAMSLFIHRIKNLPVWLATMLLGMGSWMLVAIALCEKIGSLMATYYDTKVPLSTIFGHYFETISLLLPLALFSGACFPLATRIIDPASEDAKGLLVAKVYAWNTLGALGGSLAAGFLIAPFWDFFNSLYLVAFLYCLAAMASYLFISFAKDRIPYKRGAAFLLGLISFVFAIFSYTGPHSEDYTLKLFETNPIYKIAFNSPGLQGVTTVLQDRNDDFGSQLLVNGMGMTMKSVVTKMMAHLPMSLHPDPKNTLVICMGMGTTYRSALAWGGKVTVVELVPDVVRAMNYFYKDAPEIKACHRGRIVVNDGRNFLKLTREKFDVITVDPPPPINAAGVNNLYSKEFFELASKRLNRGGIMAIWIPYPGHDTGVQDGKTFIMLARTFAKVFPYTYVHESAAGNGLHVIGSLDHINASTGSILKRISKPAVARDLSEWGPVSPQFFMSGWMKLPHAYLVGPCVTDDRPRLEFYFLKALFSGEKIWSPCGEIFQKPI